MKKIICTILLTTFLSVYHMPLFVSSDYSTSHIYDTHVTQQAAEESNGKEFLISPLSACNLL